MKINGVALKASIALCILYISNLGYVPLGKAEEIKFTFLSVDNRTQIFGMVGGEYCLHYRGNIEQLELNAPRWFDNTVEKFEEKMQSQNLDPRLIKAYKNLYRSEIDFVIGETIILLKIDDKTDKEICRAALTR